MTRISVSLIALLWLNSFVAQVLLFRVHHAVAFLSLVAFAYWTIIYALIGIGLLRQMRLAYWFGILLSVLQLVPALLWSFAAAHLSFRGSMPAWYPVSLWMSFGLGLGLLFSLLRNRPKHPGAM